MAKLKKWLYHCVDKKSEPMLMTRKFLSIIMAVFLGLISKEMYAQDPGFSQFYSNPLYLNPAFAGSVECGRLVFNYRNQWPEISKGYVTYSASYDQSLDEINSGFGFSFMNDDAGQGVLQRMYVSGFYAYQVQLTQASILRMGLQATFFQRSLNEGRLKFFDMANPHTFEFSEPTSEILNGEPTVNAADFSFGVIYANDDKYFGGVAVHHLTEPQISYYQSGSDLSRIKRKYSVHGGMNINLSRGRVGDLYDEDLVLQPNLLFQMQGEFKQLNVGAYINQSFLSVGTWFRYNFENADALIFLVGIEHNGIRFGYSYDLTLSNLGMSSGGAHEISLAADFCLYRDQSRRRIKAIKSPHF